MSQKNKNLGRCRLFDHDRVKLCGRRTRRLQCRDGRVSPTTHNCYCYYYSLCSFPPVTTVRPSIPPETDPQSTSTYRRFRSETDKADDPPPRPFNRYRKNQLELFKKKSGLRLGQVSIWSNHLNPFVRWQIARTLLADFPWKTVGIHKPYKTHIRKLLRK